MTTPTRIQPEIILAMGRIPQNDFEQAILNKSKELFEQGCQAAQKTYSTLSATQDDYTVKEAAEILGLSEGSLGLYINWGCIPTRKEKRLVGNNRQQVIHIRQQVIHILTKQAIIGYFPFVSSHRKTYRAIAAQYQQDYDAWLKTFDMPAQASKATLQQQQHQKAEVMTQKETLPMPVLPQPQQKETLQASARYHTSHGLPPADTIFENTEKQALEVPFPKESLPRAPMTLDEEQMLEEWEQQDRQRQQGQGETTISLRQQPSPKTTGQARQHQVQGRRILSAALETIYSRMDAMGLLAEPTRVEEVSASNLRLWNVRVSYSDEAQPDEDWQVLHDGNETMVLSSRYQQSLEQRLDRALRDMAYLQKAHDYYKGNTTQGVLRGYTEDLQVCLEKRTDCYIIRSDEFGIAAQGKTKDEAEQIFRRLLAGLCTNLQQQREAYQKQGKTLEKRDVDLLLTLEYNLKRLS